jgi:hypothetical protein
LAELMLSLEARIPRMATNRTFLAPAPAKGVSALSRSGDPTGIIQAGFEQLPPGRGGGPIRHDSKRSKQ